MVISIVFVLFMNKEKILRQRYETEIAELNTQMQSNKRSVLVPKIDINPGSQLSMDILEEKEIVSDLPEEEFLTDTVDNKYACIQLKENQPILKTMVIGEKVDSDIRGQEFAMMILQTGLTKNDFVDVRIDFSNGEDYIVLAKKQVKEIDLQSNIINLWLDEKEIMMISSAIIDAYLHKGSKIYTTKYVQPNIQEAAVPNYVANKDVLNIMKTNPNILEKAKVVLNEIVRENLEIRLNQLLEDKATNVEGKVQEEINAIKAKIEKDNNEKLEAENSNSVEDENEEETFESDGENVE